MPNPFCHVELNTTDVKKAKDFYGKLFDWKLEDMPGDYTMIGVGEGTGGGMMKNPIPGAPSRGPATQLSPARKRWVGEERDSSPVGTIQDSIRRNKWPRSPQLPVSTPAPTM